MRHYTVYQTTNLLNGFIYIGKHETNNPNDRYLGSGKLISRAIKKHGRENFKKEVLFDFQTEAEMNAKEAELVDEDFCLREDTYNICHGGKGGWGYVNKHINTHTKCVLKLVLKVAKPLEKLSKNDPKL